MCQGQSIESFAPCGMPTKRSNQFSFFNLVRRPVSRRRKIKMEKYIQDLVEAASAFFVPENKKTFEIEKPFRITADWLTKINRSHFDDEAIVAACAGQLMQMNQPVYPRGSNYATRYEAMFQFCQIMFDWQKKYPTDFRPEKIKNNQIAFVAMLKKSVRPFFNLEGIEGKNQYVLNDEEGEIE